jgi:hypothetical protein
MQFACSGNVSAWMWSVKSAMVESGRHAPTLPERKDKVMSLVRLIYASRLTSGVGANDIQDVLRVSRENNEQSGITGVLCYDPAFFLQCLEGERMKVNELYADILGDPRHRDVIILEFSDIDRRMFSSWSMAYVRLDEMTKPILLKYGPTATFDPYTMSGRQCVAFIQEVAEERQAFLEKEQQRLAGQVE